MAARICPYSINTNNEPGKYELACYSRNARAGAPEPQAARPGARAGRARARGNRACRVQWRRQPWWASAWSRRWATARTASRRLCQPLRAGSSDRATARPRICKRATAHRQPAAAPRGWSADERRGRPAARFDRPSFGRQGRRQGRLRRTSRLLRTAANPLAKLFRTFLKTEIESLKRISRVFERHGAFFSQNPTRRSHRKRRSAASCHARRSSHRGSCGSSALRLL